LAVVPKGHSWCSREIVKPSRKLTNQLLDERFGLAALKEVSLTDIGARPVDSVTARAMTSESTRTKVYLLSDNKS